MGESNMRHASDRQLMLVQHCRQWLKYKRELSWPEAAELPLKIRTKTKRSRSELRSLDELGNDYLPSKLRNEQDKEIKRYRYQGQPKTKSAKLSRRQLEKQMQSEANKIFRLANIERCYRHNLRVSVNTKRYPGIDLPVKTINILYGVAGWNKQTEDSHTESSHGHIAIAYDSGELLYRRDPGEGRGLSRYTISRAARHAKDCAADLVGSLISGRQGDYSPACQLIGAA